ncbi:MAG: GDP-mannose 4,6-dehydratase [Chloroflexi bacterium]|nr:GDP-mannose 4,6-dehydratase [Chloroflexota bacterium]
MRVLITGITGFVGSHMADYLLTKKGVEIYGIKRWSSRLRNIHHILEKIPPLLDCDITDYSAVRNALEKVQPDWVFHFAAQSYVHSSWTNPAGTITTNIIGTLNFLEAMRHLRINPRFQVAGSGEEYGLVREAELPITERSELRPVNPYAVSKVAQDLLCYEHYMSYGLNVIRTRAFNHEGPRRDNVFGIPSFAYQIARIENGLQEPTIKVGNLFAKRNWTDVRDMVKAYYLAMEKCKPGELYLIGSNAVYTVDECLQRLLQMSPEGKRTRVETDPEKVRPTEVPLLIGDYTKFVSQTGWKPEIPFEDTLRDTLNYWREFIGKGMY